MDGADGTARHCSTSEPNTPMKLTEATRHTYSSDMPEAVAAIHVEAKRSISDRGPFTLPLRKVSVPFPRPENMDVHCRPLALFAKMSSVDQGGFGEFKSRYPELCESSANDKTPASTAKKLAVAPGAVPMSPRFSQNSLSQPCLPLTSAGPTKILPYLYLGSQQDAMDEASLKKHGIEFVVNLSINCPKPPHIDQRRFLRIPVNDSYQEKLAPHFEKAFRFIDAAHHANTAVLVHCLAGISRSPTLAIAYIMTHLHMSSDEAYTYVKRKRQSISPNFNFMGQLLEYEKRLKKTQGKEVAARLRQQSSLKKPPNPRRSVNQAAVRTQFGIAAMTGGISTGLSALFNKMRERAAQMPDECLSETDADSARMESFKAIALAEKSTVKFNAKKKSDEENDFVMTDDEEPAYMRRSLSCPIKMQKSASETRLSIRGRPEFENFAEEQPAEIEPSVTAHTNENGKRPSTAVTEATETKVTCSMVKSQSMYTTPMPSLLSRPCGGLFDRWRQKRGLNIPHAVNEDLPSPSTDLNKRLSFNETTPPTVPSSASNPFFASRICAASLCGMQSTNLDATTPCADTPHGIDFYVVSQQPCSSAEPMECQAAKMSAENPMFRKQPANSTLDTYRQSTSSTDSGMSIGPTPRQNSANKISNLARQEIVEETSELGVCRSSSETHLAAMDLESPESGFGDNRPRQFLPESQHDRTSLTGSTSSLEIPVN